MKRRTPILAVVTAVVLTLVGTGPAQAELDDPVVADLDTSTAGHVTGTVSSIAPYVSVRLGTDVDPQIVTLTDGSGTFDLETWGYAGSLPLYVASCEVESPAAPEDCSVETASAATFVPTDLVPAVTWPADTTVGPADQPTVTVSDPDGGGDLRAVWTTPGTTAATAVPRDVATPLELTPGTGTVELVRCRAGSTTVCTGFDPAQTVDLTVRDTVAATVGPVNAISGLSPTSQVTVTVDAAGSYDLTWALEQGGVAVEGRGGVASGNLDGSGTTAPFTLDGSGLADGTYDIVVAITVTDPDFGPFGETEAVGTVVVDNSGPAVTLTASVPTVYPLIAINAYPTLTRIDVAGDPSAITGFVVRTASGTVVRHLVRNGSKTVWNGRTDAGKVAYATTYYVAAVDADGNQSASTAAVTVSRQTLVLRKYVRDVTASGTMYDKYVGRCSILKSRSSRWTPGSLGYHANSRCGTQTFAASAVSTAHAFQIPDLVKYVDWHINVVGGGSRGYHGSEGVLRYLTTTGNWAGETVVSTGYGIHKGPTWKLNKFLDENNYLVWGFLTGYNNHYDVTRFTVVVRYYALS